MSFDPNRPAAPEPFSPTAPEATPVPTSPVIPSPVAAAPAVLPTARKRSRGGGLLNIVLVLAAAVAIGGVAFAVGRTTAPVSAATGNRGGNLGVGAPGASFGPRASGQPGFGRGGVGGGGLTVNGTVVSVTADTLTIKTAAGQTVVVTTGSATTYHTQAAASPSDVQAGKTVQVQLDFGGAGRPSASATTSGPVGTAGSVTVIP